MGAETPDLGTLTIMKSADIIKTPASATIKEVMNVIDRSSMQIALIVDDTDKLIGTITDGDIRRGLLGGLELDSPIESIIHQNPTVGSINDSREKIINIAVLKKLQQIPIIDENGKLLGIEVLDELITKEYKPNKVILMAGGLGSRLGELTKETPKPMLNVGNKPILATIIENFSKNGFNNIVLSVNYKANIIEDYFKDGRDFGVNITYIYEEKKMGTAGSLGLLKEKPSEPFFVMNGDILTNINFKNLLDYHILNNSFATMCVRDYQFQIPYGIVKIDNNKITGIEEKPIQKFFVSAGIYVLHPDSLNYIPKDKFYDMPTLFEVLIKEKRNIMSFPINDYWLDIGQLSDYERANNDYKKIF